MKRFLAPVLAFCAFVLPCRADKLDEWYKLVPKNTFALVAVKDVPELLADWDKQSFSKFLADEQVQRWIAPARKDGQWPWDAFFKEMNGETLEQTLKRYNGSMLVVMAADSPDEVEDNGSDFAVCLSEAGDKQKELEDMKLREWEIRKKEEPELKGSKREIGGVTVNILAYDSEDDAGWDDGYAFVNGVMVEATALPLMEHFVAALNTGAAEGSPVVSGHLARMEGLTEGNTDVTIYLNGEQLVGWLETTLKDKAGANANAAMDPSLFLNALGTAELQALSVHMDFADVLSRMDVTLLHPEKPQGLVSLFRGTATEVTTPTFIPADVMAGNVSRYSLEASYDKLMGMVAKLGPLSMMAVMQIGQIEQQMGVKIKEDLLGSLDDEYFDVADGGLEDESQVVAFKVKDRARLAGALESLKRFAGNGFGVFEESDYLGFQVNSLKMAQAQEAGKPATEIAYCLADGYLLLGTGKLTTLKKVLARMKDPSGPSIWDSPQVQEQIKLLPPKYIGLGVADGGKQMQTIAAALGALQGQAGVLGKKGPKKKKGPGKGPKAAAEEDLEDEGDEEGLESYFDAKAVPSSEVFKRYFGSSVTGMYNPPDAVHVRVLSTSVEGR